MRVVVAGGANIDLLGRSAEPMHPGVSNPGRVRISPGGAGRNVAENLARLGARVNLISAVGAGPLGQWLIDRTALAGVDVTQTVKVEGRGSYYVGIDSAGVLEWAVSDMGAVESLAVGEINAHAELLRTADAVVVDANLLPASIRRVVELATGQVCLLPVSAAKAVRVRDVLDRSSLMVLTSRETEVLTGRPTGTPDEVLHAGRDLQSRGASVVVITAGDQGMVWIGRDVTWARVAPPSTVDSTGAGDAVAAVAVYSMLIGIDQNLAARLAAAAGAMTVAVEGATHPELTREALDRYAELAKSL
jgi:pseudouridine kinase